MMTKNKSQRVHNSKTARILLAALTVVAEKNATTLCRGLMYEPELPRKLKRNYILEGGK